MPLKLSRQFLHISLKFRKDGGFDRLKYGGWGFFFVGRGKMPLFWSIFECKQLFNQNFQNFFALHPPT